MYRHFHFSQYAPVDLLVGSSSGTADQYAPVDLLVVSSGGPADQYAPVNTIEAQAALSCSLASLQSRLQVSLPESQVRGSNLTSFALVPPLVSCTHCASYTRANSAAQVSTFKSCSCPQVLFITHLFLARSLQNHEPRRPTPDDLRHHRYDTCATYVMDCLEA